MEPIVPLECAPSDHLAVARKSRILTIRGDTQILLLVDFGEDIIYTTFHRDAEDPIAFSSS